MYNDNRTTIPQDQDAMLHEYQMDRYPSYRKNYNSKKYEQDMLQSHGLEPSMGDPMFALLGPSSKGFHALGGAATSRVGRGMDNMINVPMVEGRRNALKTAGVAGGATALGIQPAVQAIKMFGDDVAKVSSKGGINLAEMEAKRAMLNKTVFDNIDELGKMPQANRLSSSLHKEFIKNSKIADDYDKVFMDLLETKKPVFRPQDYKNIAEVEKSFGARTTENTGIKMLDMIAKDGIHQVKGL